MPNDLKSFLVYKFTWASCSSSYIGETCRHFKTRSISKRITSLIFLNIYTLPKHALIHIILFVLKSLIKIRLNSTKFDLKIKEVLHIDWRKPNLNAQQNIHYSFVPLAPFCLCLFFFCFLFFFYISLSSIVFNISNYRYLLLS